MNQLAILGKHRDDLLLAEAIGWLHDYRKCSEEHLKAQAPGSRTQALPRTHLTNSQPHLQHISLILPPVQPASRAVIDLLDDRTWNQDALGQFLSRCHNTAHFDKQEPAGGEQNFPDTQISSPFGFERLVGTGLTNSLWSLPWMDLQQVTTNRKNLRESIGALFSQTIADSRRPINEVDLWSWGLLVGALYKSALAGALLHGGPPAARDLRWRLLGIRLDGLNYLLNAARIPDLLARQELLTNGLTRVRELLEVTWPLGSEVYRDENGSIYVVPNVSDLLERSDNNGTSLRTLIQQAFAQGTVKGRPNLQLGGEMMPHLELEPTPWWGQDPGWPNSVNDELPDISGFLARQIASAANPEAINPYWHSASVADICTVCGLRPQGPGNRAKDRHVCDICEQRRANRSQEWATSQTDKTIWNDEVADVNGRLALITGQFDLSHWLDGRLLETLLVIAPNDPPNSNGDPVTSKTSSFSRLRRIWETTRTFWNEVQTEILHDLSDDRRRLKIFLNGLPRLGPFHAYDLTVGASELSVVWVPSENHREGYLISIDNLCYLARQLGAETDIYKDPAASAIFVEDYLRAQFVEQSRQPVLYNADAPAGRGKKNLINGIFIRELGYQTNQYATALPILAEPRSFMMLVPAEKSLAILQRIKEKYEEEMGKVRDRLPLHLGCVYAHRRIPLHAVLDAGRALFNQRTTFQKWSIQSLKTGAGKLELGLERKGYYLNWKVPLIMGDRTTEDRWYPYIFLETGGDDKNADSPNRRAFKASRPDGNGNTRESWLVHAADLRPGETIYLMPSTFDFEYLDAASRRFEIHYDPNGRRPARPSRPFYLEDLGRLDELWQYLQQLSRTQLKQILQTIETTRERWFGRDEQNQSAGNDTFRQFVADTLANAQWAWPAIPPAKKDRLIIAAVRGELADLAELHLEILKEKNEKENNKGVTP